MNLKRILQSVVLVVFSAEFLAAVSFQNIAALCLAVVVHELGHLSAVSLMGMKILGVHIEPCGLRLDYMGLESCAGEIVAALAGPLLGLLFSLLSVGSDYFLLDLSGKLSLIYSGFNLLPVFPLDGGRIFMCLSENVLGAEDGERISKYISLLLSVILLFLGFAYSMKGEGNAVFAAAMWLILLQSQN